MITSELRSLFELSQKLRPQDADRFKKTCPASKNDVISPKNDITTNTNLVGSQRFAEPIAIRSTWPDFQKFELAPPPSITVPSMCLSKQRAQNGYQRLPASSSNRIVLALIITINISCTGSRRQKACIFAMPLPRIGVVELTNAPYPKHVPFTDTSALTNIAVTPAVQPTIGY